MPKLSEITCAPSRAAVFSAVARLATPSFLASTTRILQCGQTADTIETSSMVSTSHPEGTADAGSGPALPFWLTTRRHPVDSLHAPSP